MTETIRNGIRSFLQITPPQPNVFQIMESMDYYQNAVLNRIWVNGDSNELSQLYKQLPGENSTVRFWAAVPTVGNDINKLHTGLPGIMCRILTDIVLADMNDITISDKYQETWDKIAEDNQFDELLEESLKNVLIVGDGAFKISIDPELTEYPIIEFIPGDRLEYVYKRGRLSEIVFRTEYFQKGQKYVLTERYGFGYVKSELTKAGVIVPLGSIEETKDLTEIVEFQDDFMMAQQFMAFKSDRYKGRGRGIFDGKADSFDSLDEVWSQWMDALRRGRSKEYIPESLLPRNPNTGEILPPNAFDHAYIKMQAEMAEDEKHEIDIKQPAIPHESYQATYITALDLCLQGILSPSTLGIDVKKLDNADAQREKEKVTLYTRNKLVRAIQKTVPSLVKKAIQAWNTMNKRTTDTTKIDVDVTFGEYANPSFESQVETVGKGKTQGIMSTEACVDELYGDSRDEEWKALEVSRLKAEQGITEMQEPEISLEAGTFRLNGFGADEQERDTENESQGSEQNVPDEQGFKVLANKALNPEKEE